MKPQEIKFEARGGKTVLQNSAQLVASRPSCESVEKLNFFDLRKAEIARLTSAGSGRWRGSRMSTGAVLIRTSNYPASCSTFSARFASHSRLPTRLSAKTMSSNSESSSPFQAVFDAALNEYAGKTGKHIAEDPLTVRLQSCNSPDEVHVVLQEQVQGFNEFRNGDGKVQLMRKLRPTVEVLLSLSKCEILRNAIGLVSVQMQSVIVHGHILVLILDLSAYKCNLGRHRSLSCSPYLVHSIFSTAFVTP
jgi:hypothetical protein